MQKQKIIIEYISIITKTLLLLCGIIIILNALLSTISWLAKEYPLQKQAPIEYKPFEKLDIEYLVYDVIDKTNQQ